MDTEQLSRVLAACEGVDVGDAIAAKKLANARMHCRVPPFDRVIALIDCTVFGSAKHAVVFTDRAVYLCDRWTSDHGGAVAFTYDQLAALEVDRTVRFAPGISVPRRTLSHATIAALVAVRDAARPRAVAPVVVADEPAVAVPAEPGIEATPEAVALQAAITATPDDAGPQLVLADLLLSVDDPRGELIVLDRRERESPDGITDPEALERYLVLAAEYSFPRATPEDPTLSFRGSRSNPPRHRVYHAVHDYEVIYADRVLTVIVDGRRPGVRWRLDLEERDSWTHDEGLVILRLLSDAIRARAPLRSLCFPFGRRPLPIYDGGPLRGYRLPSDFLEPRGLPDTRFGLAARDYERWMKLWHRLARILKQRRRAG